MRVEVDFALCESNAVCVGLSPEVFDLGDDDQLRIVQPDVTERDAPQVRDAVLQCPRQAIQLVD
ncbi:MULTISPECIES: ferredoxin [unclassified Mycobacterium]|uniref:ferredoxin n=1 Tax=unclassified Mycobacterium TaxID=2642494 RepID=UPI0029C89A43|nr:MULTISPECIES: ferredoxin [unclassified Mycobacterium]